METYRKSILEYQDVRDAVNFAREEGFEKGIEQEKILMAQNCLKKGFSIEIIAELTGLSSEQIESLNK